MPSHHAMRDAAGYPLTPRHAVPEPAQAPLGTVWYFDRGRLALRHHRNTGYEVRWGKSHRFVPLYASKAEHLLATHPVEHTEPFDPTRRWVW